MIKCGKIEKAFFIPIILYSYFIIIWKIGKITEIGKIGENGKITEIGKIGENYGNWIKYIFSYICRLMSNNFNNIMFSTVFYC